MLKKIKEMPTPKLVVGTVLIMFLTATSIYWFTGRAAAKTPDGKPKKTFIVTLGDFTTNLGMDEFMRQSIIKVSIDLEVENQKAAAAATKKLSQIRNTVLAEIWGTTLLELNGTDGREKLKQNLIVAVNKQIAPFELTDLYFVDMVVQ